MPVEINLVQSKHSKQKIKAECAQALPMRGAYYSRWRQELDITLDYYGGDEPDE